MASDTTAQRGKNKRNKKTKHTEKYIRALIRTKEGQTNNKRQITIWEENENNPEKTPQRQQ